MANPVEKPAFPIQSELPSSLPAASTEASSPSLAAVVDTTLKATDTTPKTNNLNRLNWKQIALATTSVVLLVASVAAFIFSASIALVASTFFLGSLGLALTAYSALNQKSKPQSVSESKPEPILDFEAINRKLNEIKDESDNLLIDWPDNLSSTVNETDSINFINQIKNKLSDIKFTSDENLETLKNSGFESEAYALILNIEHIKRSLDEFLTTEESNIDMVALYLDIIRDRIRVIKYNIDVAKKNISKKRNSLAQNQEIANRQNVILAIKLAGALFGGYRRLAY